MIPFVFLLALFLGFCLGATPARGSRVPSLVRGVFFRDGW